jgi:hypothetical protein
MAARCVSRSPVALDAHQRDLVLEALQPAALEISLQVAEDLEGERERAQHAHWQQRLERARYEAERAERQYQAVEPENRLVARTLEQHWEAALAARRSSRPTMRAFSTPSRPRCRRQSVRASADWPRHPRPVERRDHHVGRAPSHRASAHRAGDRHRHRRQRAGHRRGALDRRSSQPHAAHPPGGATGAAQLLPATAQACPMLASAGTQRPGDRRAAQRRTLAPGQAARDLQCSDGCQLCSPPGVSRWVQRHAARPSGRIVKRRNGALPELALQARHALGHLVQLAAQRPATGPPGRARRASPMADLGRHRRARAPAGAAPSTAPLALRSW